MTTKTETAAAKAPTNTSSFTFDLAATLAFAALFTWMAGVALNRGYGVHVPFIAGFILLVAGLSVVKMAAGQVAQVWHTARVKADITLIAATLAVQDAQGFLDINKKLGGEGFLNQND